MHSVLRRHFCHVHYRFSSWPNWGDVGEPGLNSCYRLSQQTNSKTWIKTSSSTVVCATRPGTHTPKAAGEPLDGRPQDRRSEGSLERFVTCAALFGALSEHFIRGRNAEHDALGFGAPHAIGNRAGFFRAFSPLLRIVQQIHFQTNRCGTCKNVGQSAAPTVIWNTDPICQ